MPPNLEYFRCDDPNLKIGELQDTKPSKVLDNENVDTFVQTLESVTRSVKEWGSSISLVHDEFITFDLCKLAIYQDASALCGIKPHLVTKDQYYELCLESVLQSGWNIKYVPKEVQTQELADIACESCCWAIEHILDEFKTYKKCLSSVEQNGQTIQFVPRNLIDKKMCIAALESKYTCLEYIPDEFITQEICTLAVRSDGENIQHVREEFMSTEMAFLAISSSGIHYSTSGMDGDNIRYIPSKYITKELIIEALKDSPTIYSIIPKECITEEIEDIALDISSYCIQYMKQTPERCMRIIKNDPHSIIYDYINRENITSEMARYILDLPNEKRKHILYNELKTFLESRV